MNNHYLRHLTWAWILNLGLFIPNTWAGLTFAQIATGYSHTCGLTTVGAVWCWGGNWTGQLGDGSTTNRATPIAVPGLASGVTTIATGFNHTCALKSDATVWCWGDNSYGQLGDGTNTDRNTPVAVLGLPSGITAIATGGSVATAHTCALKSGVGVWCWGDNYYGQLGDGTNTDRKTPTAVLNSPSGVAIIAAGYEHTCVLTNAGAVQCWGRNKYGNLGDGTTTNRSTPVAVVGLGTGVTAIMLGSDHACARKTGGAAWCWGHNDNGQLGDATTTDRYTPVAVTSLSSAVTALAGGGKHTCAIKSGGAVQCWGNNEYGQLGDGTITARYSPTPVPGLTSGVTNIAAGGNHVCAISSGGALQCWGYNDDGQLGDGITKDHHTPVAVINLFNDVTAIAAKNFHTCAIRSGGAVQCWGDNEYGQLGDGTTTNRVTPVAVQGLSNGVAAIATGYGHTCALKDDGAVLCWGYNLSGQLGDGTTTDHLTPVLVAGITGTAISIVAGYEHNCVLTSSGAVQCWGSDYGPTPVTIHSLESGVTQIAAGYYHTCILKSGGAMQCWGYNYNGQLGDGTVIDRFTPVPVPELQNGVTAIAAGYGHTCAIKNGGVWCWGDNFWNQLGDGTTTEHLTPVAVVGLANSVTTITAGSYHTCAVQNTTTRCWGNNGFGQLGDGTTTNRSTPVTVSNLTSGVTAMAAGDSHTCALISGGAVQCWGGNDYGQLGDGTLGWRTFPKAVSTVYILTPTANGPGTISPRTPLAVDYHATMEFELEADTNYRPTVSGTCGGNLSGEHLYITNPSTADCNVIVTFTSIFIAPTVTTNAASQITAANATLNGSVISNGNTATVTFDFGPTTNYGTSIAAGTVNSATAVAVSVSKTGLTCNTTYNYRIKAVNNIGTSFGTNKSFKTQACPPTASTGLAETVTATSATLVGQVNPNGAATTATFEFGENETYGLFLTASQSPLAATAASSRVTVSANGLRCNVNYYYRIKAINNAGTSYGGNIIFKTSACPKTPRALLIGGATTANDPVGNAGIASQLALAYKVLKSQGYNRDGSGRDEIKILGNGLAINYNGTALPVQPVKASDFAADTALTQWVQGGERLVIYLIGHGEIGYFDLDQTSGERLTATALDTWLDLVQPSLTNITLIDESCHSGSFLPVLAAPPVSATVPKRLLLASTAADQLAAFMANGLVSYSQMFWLTIQAGYKIKAAHYQTLQWLADRLGNPQVPQLEADGNAATTNNDSADLQLANNFCLGFTLNGSTLTTNQCIVMLASTPIIQSVTAAQTLNGAHIANLALIAATSTSIGSAWVVIERPDYQLDSTSTFATQPTIVLTKDAANPARWFGRYATGDIGKDGDIQRGPDVQGVYKLNYYVASSDGLVSTPVASTITQNIGLAPRYTTPALFNVTKNQLNFPIAQLWTTGLSRSLFTRANSTSLFQLNNLTSLATTGITNTNPPRWNAPTNVVNIPRLIKNGDIQYYKGTLTRTSSVGTQNQWTFNLIFTPDTALPSATTNPATNITFNSAILNGIVNDNGAATTVTFDFGPTAGYGTSIAAVPSTVAVGTGNKTVAAGKTGLLCNTLYHYRVKAVNSVGTYFGLDKTFTTAAACPLPTATTGAATFKVATGTTLSGTVAPRGSATTVNFNYGLTTAYGTTLTATPNAISGGALNTVVTAKIASGLTCGKTYHYRVTATNGSGTALGGDKSFVACSDIYEPEETQNQAAVIWIVDPSLPQPLPSEFGIEIPQIHTIHNVQDQDWFVFEATDIDAYEIKTLTPQGSPLNLRIDLYNSQEQLLKSMDWNVAGECDVVIPNYGECETLTFYLASFNLVPPQQLRIRISAVNYQATGQPQSYQIYIWQPYIAATGTLLGQVRTATGATAPYGTRVTSSNGKSAAITNSNGKYVLDHAPGPFNFTALSITKPKNIDTTVLNYLNFP